MHTPLSRLSFVASQSVSALAVLAGIAALYEVLCAAGMKANAPLMHAESAQPRIASSMQMQLLQGDEALLHTQVAFKCDRMFDWNTKEVFAMVFAHAVNSTQLIADRAIMHANMCTDATIALPKYPLRHPQLRGQLLNLTLTLGLVPHSGPLTNAHYRLLQNPVQLPANYTHIRGEPYTHRRNSNSVHMQPSNANA